MRNPLGRPNLGGYPCVPATASGTRGGAIAATFLGTSSVLLRDDVTALLVDGFVSRPGLLRMLLRPIGPDHRVIEECLARAGISSLAAVFCAHSHYDHALDAPSIAQRCGAILIGSESTANIGRGYGLPEDRIRTVTDGETVRFGNFAVTLVHSLHSPGDAFPGNVEVPFGPPARASAWRSGTAYSMFFAHPAGTVAVHGSANFIPGKLRGRPADVVYLGIGALGKQTPQFRTDYWREVVLATGARRVIPVHWDDFWRSLSSPLRPQRYVYDRVDVAMAFLRRQGLRDGVEVVLPESWQVVDPIPVRSR